MRPDRDIGAGAALLAVSLLVNVGCAVWIWREGRWPTDARVRLERRVLASSPSGRGAAPAPAPLPAWNEGEKIGDRVAQLRARRIPEGLVRAVAESAVRFRHERETAELFYPKGKKFWEMNRVFAREIAPLERTVTKEVEEALGYAVDLRSESERALRQRLYGDFSEEKIEAVQLAMADFVAAREAVPANAPDRAGRLAEIRRKEDEALGRVLTTAELAEYRKRQMDLARPPASNR